MLLLNWNWTGWSTKPPKFGFYFSSIASSYHDQDIFSICCKIWIFGHSVMYILLCFPTTRIYIPSNLHYFLAAETIFLLPPWKLRFYSLLSSPSSYLENRIAWLEGNIKVVIINKYATFEFIVSCWLFSWFIMTPRYPLSILSLTLLYCSMIVWQKIFTLV